MNVHAVEPVRETGTVLAGAQFADAFRITIDDTTLDARHAAEKMLARSPRWIETLMRLRNRVVAPFGLKTPVRTGTRAGDTVGIFPVLSQKSTGPSGRGVRRQPSGFPHRGGRRGLRGRPPSARAPR